MSIEHETFIETATKEQLEGYIAALKNVRDTIEHQDSTVITETQRWLEDAEAKLTTLVEEAAAAAKVCAAGKPVGGEGSAASSPAVNENAAPGTATCNVCGSVILMKDGKKVAA